MFVFCFDYFTLLLLFSIYYSQINVVKITFDMTSNDI